MHTVRVEAAVIISDDDEDDNDAFVIAASQKPNVSSTRYEHETTTNKWGRRMLH